MQTLISQLKMWLNQNPMVKKHELEIWVVLRKTVPNALSWCHTKRRTGAHGRVHPSLSMTPKFQKKKKKKFKILFQKKKI